MRVREMRTGNKYMKKYSSSLVIREIQNKSTVRFHFLSSI